MMREDAEYRRNSAELEENRDMMLPKLTLAGLVAVWLHLPGAQAQTSSTIKIGVLADMSGLYSDLSGIGSVVATQLAAEDFGGTVLGRKIEVVSADHQNKPDIGSNIARQ
jgi:branched-chain amino acid transport system substrate-binding protein